MSRILALFFLPPLNFFFLFLLGFALRPHRRRLGNALLVTAGTLYLLCSIPGIWIGAMNLLEDRSLALTTSDPRARNGADAIVVLGAGRVMGAPELGGHATVQRGAFERLRFAARLQRVNGKPILTSGGSPGGPGDSEAELMKETLEEDFHVPVRWMETHSVNTIENARMSAAILFPLGIKRIFLVTHAAHMQRARFSFEKAGFTVVTAPVGFVSAEVDLADPKTYVPNPQSLSVAFDAMHEWIGLLWYKFRF